MGLEFSTSAVLKVTNDGYMKEILYTGGKVIVFDDGYVGVCLDDPTRDIIHPDVVREMMAALKEYGYE